MDDRTLEAFAYANSAANIAFSLLVRCLKKNGLLGDGQFEAELRATIEHTDAPRHRLDYQRLQNLLDLSPPHRLIKGLLAVLRDEVRLELRVTHQVVAQRLDGRRRRCGWSAQRRLYIVPGSAGVP